MPSAPQHILAGETSTLISYPPIAALPSAATIRLQTPSTSLPDSSVAATIDSTDTTLSAAAAEGAKSVVVVSATGITVGRQYPITGNGIGTVIVQVQRVDGTTIYLESPLPVAVPSGADFDGWAVTFSTADTALDGEGLAKWTATIGGVVHQWDQQYKVVKDNINPPLTAATLEANYPAVQQLKWPQDGGLTQAIRAGWEQRLAPDLRTRDLDLNKINSWELLEPVHAKAVLWHLAFQDPGTDQEFVDRLWVEYGNSLIIAITGRGMWYDGGGSDAGSSEDRSALQTMVYTR